jgi:hypothetical protein
MFPEYLYTPATGWTLLPTEDGWLATLAPQAAHPGLALAHADYLPLAQSYAGGLGVGHFLVWQSPPVRPAGWPRYAVEILQFQDAGVVWVATLPDLWEFLRCYGTIGVNLSETLPGEEEGEGEDDEEADEEEAGGGVAICADCYAQLAAAMAAPDPVGDDPEERRLYDDA